MTVVQASLFAPVAEAAPSAARNAPEPVSGLHSCSGTLVQDTIDPALHRCSDCRRAFWLGAARPPGWGRKIPDSAE